MGICDNEANHWWASEGKASCGSLWCFVEKNNYRGVALNSKPLLGKIWCPSQPFGQSGQSAFEVINYDIPSQSGQRLQTTVSVAMPVTEIIPEESVLMWDSRIQRRSLWPEQVPPQMRRSCRETQLTFMLLKIEFYSQRKKCVTVLLFFPWIFTERASAVCQTHPALGVRTQEFQPSSRPPGS